MDHTLGKRIVRHRKRLLLTQDQLAEQLSVTAQAVSKWENDQFCSDITMIPKLAAIFGISTDSLLGCETVHTAELVTDAPNKNSEKPKESKIEFHYGDSKRTSIAFGILVLLIGIALLFNEITHKNISFWNILWPSSLLAYGLLGIYPHFRFFRLGCLIFGAYMLLSNLSFLPLFKLPRNYIFPIVLLIVGIYLLLDARKKTHKPNVSFTYNANKKHENHFSIDGESFQFDEAFSENHQLIEMGQMSKGCITTNFGDYTLDLSGVERVSGNCTIVVPVILENCVYWYQSAIVFIKMCALYLQIVP